MKNFHVSKETNKLKQTTGYWSEQRIFCNLTHDQIILLQEKSNADILEEISNALESVTKIHLQSCFQKWLGKSYLGPLRLDAVFNQLGINLLQFQDQLHSEKYNKEKISKHLAEIWWKHHKNKPQEGIDTSKLHKIPNSLSALLVDWSSLATDTEEHFITKTCKLSQLSTRVEQSASLKPSKINSAEKIRFFLANLSAEERSLVQWALPFLSPASDQKSYFHGVRCSIHAAAALLAWFRTRQILILPLHFENVHSWLTDFSVWPSKILNGLEARNAIRGGLFNFIASSTSESVDDIPPNLLDLYGADNFKLGFYNHLAQWLKHPAIEKGRHVFPIDKLQLLNQKHRQYEGKWTLKWIKTNCNEEWYDFAYLWWQHAVTDSSKISTLRCYLEWAWEDRSFSSPWDIKPEDLRNPHRPSFKGTFQYFLKNKNIVDKSSRWSNSATLCRIVYQLAQLPDAPCLIQGPIKDPFASINNPFSKSQPRLNKTPRSSLLPTIHEMMIEILLSPDQDGTPTYSWARQITEDSGLDSVKVPDPEKPTKEITIWSPSRAACLAILLLTPFRVVQARWLDQGLMDNECYDFSTKSMVPNHHILKNFTYKNGKSHEEQYGNPSGVLQFSSDLLSRERALCIYVNTNKTQLWNGLRRTGYKVPWPDGSQLLASNEPALREKGKWLARVYRVIESQMNWMNRYDPNPHPLSFFQSREDRKRVTDLAEVESNMPWFVPLFRDLSLAKFVTDSHLGIPFRSSTPVSRSKIDHLYYLLAIETEKQFKRKTGHEISLLTPPDKDNARPRCKFDLHSLRVTWISRLFEMGVPAHIISEYVAGHATALMTIHYLKCQPVDAREKLLQAALNGETSGGFEAIEKRYRSRIDAERLLVAQKKNTDIFDLLPDDFTSFAPVEGGLCPMGGKGSMCSQGGTQEQNDENNSSSEVRHTHVQGGCGNCRFFLTGPDFIIEQLFACNHLMLKMRALGREEKQVYLQLDEMKHELHHLTPKAALRAQRLEREKKLLSERINSFEESLSSQCIEWFNRYEMLLASFDLLLDQEIGQEDRRLILLGGTHLTVDDFAIESQESTDFGLVRTIIEQARLVKRQGIPLPEDASRMLREFMNIILSENSPQNLLLQIPDQEYATHAASVLAGWLHDTLGEENDKTIQRCIDQRIPLPLSVLNNQDLQTLADNIIANFGNKNESKSSNINFDSVRLDP